MKNIYKFLFSLCITLISAQASAESALEIYLKNNPGSNIKIKINSELSLHMRLLSNVVIHVPIHIQSDKLCGFTESELIHLDGRMKNPPQSVIEKIDELLQSVALNNELVAALELGPKLDAHEIESLRGDFMTNYRIYYSDLGYFSVHASGPGYERFGEAEVILGMGFTLREALLNAFP